MERKWPFKEHMLHPCLKNQQSTQSVMFYVLISFNTDYAMLGLN